MDKVREQIKNLRSYDEFVDPAEGRHIVYDDINAAADTLEAQAAVVDAARRVNRDNMAHMGTPSKNQVDLHFAIDALDKLNG